MTWYDDNEGAAKPEPQKCDDCGREKTCARCDATPHTVEDLYQGWRFRTPMGRWETVTRVEQETKYSPVRIWTDKTGPEYSWKLNRWTKVKATPPDYDNPGEPEIRIIEHTYSREAPMWAVLTSSHIRNADTETVLVQAGYAGAGKGWTIVHYPNGGNEQAVEHADSKAKARTALMAAARQHAKALKIRVRKQEAR
jgi:hypothetical protein